MKPASPLRAGEGAVETGVAFARADRASDETAIAFADEKWVFFVRFSVAEVLPVSTVAVLGRALVMVVSFGCAKGSAVVTAVSLGDCELTGSGTAVPEQMMAAVVHAVRS